MHSRHNGRSIVLFSKKSRSHYTPTNQSIIIKNPLSAITEPLLLSKFRSRSSASEVINLSDARPPYIVLTYVIPICGLTPTRNLNVL